MFGFLTKPTSPTLSSVLRISKFTSTSLSSIPSKSVETVSIKLSGAKMSSNTVYIPIDIVAKILVKLRVKSLLRLKSVSKSWYSLIKSGSFINNQLKHASSIHDNYRIVIKHCLVNSVKVHVSFLSDNACSVFDSTLDVPVPISLFDDDDDEEFDLINVTFYGPCNGVVCALGDARGDLIALWNLSTRETKRLPFSDIPNGHCDAKLNSLEIGFGFDAKSQDYKVVKIIDFDKKDDRELLDSFVEVYDLSTARWRKVVVTVPTYRRVLQREALSIYLDGFYYWWSVGADSCSILSFDFAYEVFDKISPPDRINDHRVTLMKYRESLALVFANSEYSVPDSIEIWVMNKSMGKSTWFKLCRIISRFYDIFGIFSNGNALIRTTSKVEGEIGSRDFKVGICDSSSRQFKNIRVYDDKYDGSCLQVVNYVSSLVCVNGNI